LDKSSEIEHIDDLLSDFGVKPEIKPHDVLKLTKVRYDTLINILFEITSKIIHNPGKNFPAIFLQISKVIHNYSLAKMSF
jgi:hypothetical protein